MNGYNDRRVEYKVGNIMKKVRLDWSLTFYFIDNGRIIFCYLQNDLIILISQDTAIPWLQANQMRHTIP